MGVASQQQKTTITAMCNDNNKNSTNNKATRDEKRETRDHQQTQSQSKRTRGEQEAGNRTHFGRERRPQTNQGRLVWVANGHPMAQPKSKTSRKKKEGAAHWLGPGLDLACPCPAVDGIVGSSLSPWDDVSVFLNQTLRCFLFFRGRTRRLAKHCRKQKGWSLHRLSIESTFVGFSILCAPLFFSLSLQVGRTVFDRQLLLGQGP